MLTVLKDFIRIKFFLWGDALAVEAMIVRLKVIAMSPMRTMFSVRAVLLGLGLLCLGGSNDRSFAQSNPHPTARLMAISSTEATPLMLQRPTKDGDVSVVVEAGVTNRAGSQIPELDGARVFSAASARWQGLMRTLSVPVCLSQILIPKVSRHISKSVLIL
ncbi:MAG TPA: hypothetical protein VF452_03890 [Candidatus Binatia bacterium]